MNNKTIVLIFPRLNSSEMMEAAKVKDHPPLGILTIAAPLVEQGYDVRILDEQVEKDFYAKLDSVLGDKPICVGISSMSGSHIKSSLRVCKYIKEKSNVPVVLGGVHVSLSPDSSIRNELVDIIIMDDGEEVFFKLVKCLEVEGDLSKIDGIAFKEGGKVVFNKPAPPSDITKLPKIPYYLVDLDKYQPGFLHFWPTEKRILAMETSRGCPYSCSFCTESVRKKKWRSLPAERVIKDIEYYKEKYGVSNFLFIDDNFFGDKKRGEKIIDLMISRNLNINWYTNVRADFLVKAGIAFLKKLEKAGCKMLTFGAESGTQRIMDMIDKNGDVRALFKINNMIKKTNIIPHFCTIRGFPTETKYEVKNTFLLNFKLLIQNRRACCDFPHLIPTPGTKIAKECLGEKVGSYTLDDWEKAFEVELQPEKPIWVLNETYKFMKENKGYIRLISYANRRKLSPVYGFIFRLYLMFVVISIKLGFSKYVSNYAFTFIPR
ncbi:MAG: B12-binding domain-containing radical SAM protein [Bacillota bacterium]